ncbi:MAG: PglZ domain-containing protein [Methanobacterium sp.]|nr:PglZ domain-containing protein [Methanobacterium sp.]
MQMWYEKIITLIEDLNVDVLFVIDPTHLIDYQDIKNKISEKYYICTFENEIRLRRILRENFTNLMIVFNDKEALPYDLLSNHAQIKIGPSDIFPYLNEEIVSSISFNDYQKIYRHYLKKKDDFFEQLSKKDTETFLKNMALTEDDSKYKAYELTEQLKKQSFNINSSNWGKIANIYGEIMYLVHKNNLSLEIDDLINKIQSEFIKFILNDYEDLTFDTKSHLNSNLLNIIKIDEKIALICFDCMGFEEWQVIYEYLKENTNLEFDVKYSFSILPSETGYSRGALFSGLVPLEIPEKKSNLRIEEELFKEALSNHNIDENDVYFNRFSKPDEVPEDYAFEDYEALGIIFSFVDEIVHNKLMDKNLLINSMETLLRNSKLDMFLDSLVQKGFKVYLCSDHGNIFSQGNGINVPKKLVNEKALRYLISEHKNILKEYKDENSIIIQFKKIMGEEYILLMTGNSMLGREKNSRLTHGGISIEEVVLPFIEVKSNERI